MPRTRVSRMGVSYIDEGLKLLFCGLFVRLEGKRDRVRENYVAQWG